MSKEEKNYDKKLSIPENCISLCQDCHRKTDTNHKSWIFLFQNLLSNKYGYNYKDNKPIIHIEFNQAERQ